MQEPQETWLQSLGQEDRLEQGMATRSSICAWRIPWTEEPGGLQSTGLRRVGYDWVTWHTQGPPLFACTSLAKMDSREEVYGYHLLWGGALPPPLLTSKEHMYSQGGLLNFENEEYVVFYLVNSSLLNHPASMGVLFSLRPFCLLPQSCSLLFKSKSPNSTFISAAPQPHPGNHDLLRAKTLSAPCSRLGTQWVFSTCGKITCQRELFFQHLIFFKVCWC